MQVAAWIDQLAADIVATTSELRKALRRLHYDPGFAKQVHTPCAANAHETVRLGAHEARTLLRAAQPFSQSLRPCKDEHAHLVAAMSTAAVRLLGLNEGAHAGPAAIGAVLDLRDAIDAWTKAARWQQATTAAGASWPVQPRVAGVSITNVPRQSTAENPERSSNPELLDDLPNMKPEDGRARRWKRPRVPEPVQRELLFPIGGNAAAPAASVPAADPDTRIKAAG